jgi:hypothetical protein
MAGSKNEHLEFFRIKAALAIEQWADRMKIFIAESRLMGNELEALRKIREDPESTWSAEREALNKALKLEVAGLVNRIHQAVYSGEL